MEGSNEAVVEAIEVEVIDDIIEIEIFVKEDRPVPHAKGYVIRVDKQKITVHKHEITGREILELANKRPPENYILREIFSGGRSEVVALDQIVDLHRHKVEKFKTLPRDQTEG
jgi:multiubiquitin